MGSINERHVVILVDASTSMLFEGKLDRAKELAAAFAVMGLLGMERVSVYAFNRPNGAPSMLPRCRGRASMRLLFAMVEGIEGGGEIPLETAIESLLKHHSGRGVAVVLSDFFTFGDLERACNRLFSSGLEIFGVQILAPSEIDPEAAADVRFVDSETQGTLDISSAADLLTMYQKHRAAYEENLATLCRRRSGRFVSISAADPIDWVLFDLLRRKGWIR